MKGVLVCMMPSMDLCEKIDYLAFPKLTKQQNFNEINYLRTKENF